MKSGDIPVAEEARDLAWRDDGAGPSLRGASQGQECPCSSLRVVLLLGSDADEEEGEQADVAKKVHGWTGWRTR